MNPIVTLMITTISLIVIRPIKTDVRVLWLKAGASSMFCRTTDSDLNAGYHSCHHGPTSAQWERVVLSPRTYYEDFIPTLEGGVIVIDREDQCLKQIRELIGAETITWVQMVVALEAVTVPSVDTVLETLMTNVNRVIFDYIYISRCQVVIERPKLKTALPTWIKQDKNSGELLVIGQMTWIPIEGGEIVTNDSAIPTNFSGKLCNDNLGYDNYPATQLDPDRTCILGKTQSTVRFVNSYPNIGKANRDRLVFTDTLGSTRGVSLSMPTVLGFQNAERYLQRYYNQLEVKVLLDSYADVLDQITKKTVQREMLNFTTTILEEFQKSPKELEKQEVVEFTKSWKVMIAVSFGGSILVGLLLLAFVTKVIKDVVDKRAAAAQEVKEVPVDTFGGNSNPYLYGI